MDKDTKNITKESEKSDNPETGEKPNAGTGKPSDSKGQGDPNQAVTLEKTVEELTGKLDTLNRQYKGSTEEALRLKNELDTLSQDRDKLRELVTSNSSQRIENDDTFQSIVEKEGLQEAIRRVVREETSPLSVKVDKLSDKDVDEVYNTFKLAHPGLKDDVLTKFDTEFNRLKGVYDSVEEALEASYAVIGGVKADQEAGAGSKDKKETDDLTAKSKMEKEQAIKGVSEDGKDKQGTPEDPEAQLKKRIENLRTRAATKEVNGGDARDDWAMVFNLEAELKDKSK